MAFVSGKIIRLKAKLNPSDTSLTADVDVGITQGRIYIKNDRQEEWLEFNSVTPSGANFIYGGLTRGLSQVDDPITGGVGQTWVAGNSGTVVAMHDQLFDKSLDNNIGGTQTFKNIVVTDSIRVPQYASEAARDAGIPTPSEGMEIVRTDLGVFQDYVAGSWQNRENSNSDRLVTVSGDDTTPGTLEQKITAGNAIALSTNNSGANEDLEISFDGSTESSQLVFTAGESIDAGNALYVDNSDGKVYKTDASNFDKSKFIGFSTNSALVDESVTVDISGINSNQTGLTISSDYFLKTDYDKSTLESGLINFTDDINGAGIKITTGSNPISIGSITTASTTDGFSADRIRIQSDSFVDIYTSTTFEGGSSKKFSFPNVRLDASTTYYIKVDGNGGNYRRAWKNFSSYPINKTYFDVVASFTAGSSDTTSIYVNIEEMEVTGLFDGEISEEPGETNEVRVGRSVSGTKILINSISEVPEVDFVSINLTAPTSTTTVQYSHNLNRIPTKFECSTSRDGIGLSSNGWFEYGKYGCVVVDSTQTGAYEDRIGALQNGTDGLKMTITDKTDTTFDVTYTEYGTMTAIDFGIIFKLT